MLTAFYDLSVSPPTYDFPSFLGLAERTRLQMGQRDMQVLLVPGPVEGFRQDSLWPRSAPERRRLLDRIVIAACELLPSVGERVYVVGTRREAEEVWREAGPAIFPAGYRVDAPVRCYGLGKLIESLRGEGPLPNFLAPQHTMQQAAAELPDDLVTITLRQAEHWPERNSRVGEWLAAAEEIRRLGYTVEIIADAAAEPISEVPLIRQASRNLATRAAVYRRAAMNLFINNGPAWLCWQMLDTRLLIFRLLTEGNLMTNAGWLKRQGLHPGMQLPCAGPGRRLVWKDDTAANIIAAFKDWHDGADC